MKKRVILFVLCGLGLLSAQSYRERYIIHSSHKGPYNLLVDCTNGADPTVEKWRGMLLVSCGDVRHEANPDRE